MFVIAESDTLFTGLSGLLILMVIVWLVIRALRQKA